MKLIWAVVQKEDAGGLINALIQKEYRLTRIDTAGGFLKQSNATLILGVEDRQVDDVLCIIEQNCQRRVREVNPVPLLPGQFPLPRPAQVEVGGATVFVLNLMDFRRL